MKRDPFTLHVALDRTSRARGELYLDDGETYEHQTGSFIWREFTAYNPDTRPKALHLTSKDLVSVTEKTAVHGGDIAAYDPANNFAKSVASVRIARVVILGLNKKPSQVKTDDGQVLQWFYQEGVTAGSGKKEGPASVLTIKDPAVLIINDWTIIIEE
jgi:mannosyl-oligosaccharide alpha-1,3-glucosidase